MRLPDNVIIPDTKITQYLLVARQQDDKSKYLAQGGFTLDNPERLKIAIFNLVKSINAIEDGTNEYGTFYRVEGNLIGINKQILLVTTIWLKRKIDNQFQFITLKPKKEKKNND